MNIREGASPGPSSLLSIHPQIHETSDHRRQMILSVQAHEVFCRILGKSKASCVGKRTESLRDPGKLVAMHGSV